MGGNAGIACSPGRKVTGTYLTGGQVDKSDPCMTLITDEEMLEITGARFPSKQCQILKDHDIAFVRRLDGRPRTTWFNFNHPLSSRMHPIDGYKPEDEEPDFDAIFLWDKKNKKRVEK